jgi:ataxia telangiectasia mutated family protein
MTTLLVYSGQLFSHAAIDYAKAIRSLLSYPPHLNELDPNTWRILMGVCWSAVLGDQVSVDGEFEGDLAENDDSPVVPLPTQAPASIAKGRTNVTQATNELAQLIPLLLSSTSAPITPPLPITGLTYEYEQSLALTMLYKASRFYAQQLSETTSHLPIVRSTNFLLSVLELNSRHDIVAAGMRLLPQLINLWPTRNKAIREQILIALRTMLPFLVHKNSLEKDRLGLIRNSLERLMDVLPKESTSRWGFEAIELNTVRLQTRIKGEKNPAWTKAFERRVLRVSSQRYGQPS